MDVGRVCLRVIAVGRAFSCGGELPLPQDLALVFRGRQRPAAVRKSCGPPKLREDLIREGCPDDRNCCFGKVGERWVYDLGGTYLVRCLLFTENRLTQIETGGYGENP